MTVIVVPLDVISGNGLINKCCREAGSYDDDDDDDSAIG